jgi:hypothetical protein
LHGDLNNEWLVRQNAEIGPRLAIEPDVHGVEAARQDALKRKMLRAEARSI